MIGQEVSVRPHDKTPSGAQLKRSRYWQIALTLVLLGVAAHSIGLGLTLLFFPRWALKLVGWEYSGQMFWPCQAGLFLVILGTAYGAAVRLPSLIWLVLGSKAAAVTFLLLSVVWLQAPTIVPLLGCGDGLMGLAVAVAFWQVRRAESLG